MPEETTIMMNPCRHYGERFFSGRRCKTQIFKCLKVEEEDEQEGIELEGKEHHEGQNENQEVQELVKLSLQSIVGLTAERSIKMKGKIGGTEVIVLIDSGATSNFISTELAGAIGLPITETGGFGVSVGNGQIIAGREKCAGVVLAIQGLEIIEEFLLFELGTTNVVLGYS